MKSCKLFWLLALVTFLPCLGAATYVPLRGDLTGESPQVTLLRHDADLIQLEIRIPGLELSSSTLDGKQWDRVEITGGGFLTELGLPELPTLSRLLAIPATVGVRAEFEALETRILPQLEIIPAQGRDLEDLGADHTASFDFTTYSRNEFYPQERVRVSAPALMRGTRVVTVCVNPVQYNPVSKELRVTHRFQVTLHLEGTDLRNAPVREIPLSRSWANLARQMIVNFDDLELDNPSADAVGPYMIVCENDANLISLLQNFIDWKKRKGHTVNVTTFTQGASNSTIKGIIQNAYNSWLVPPEYVLLVGDTGGDYALPGWTVMFFEQIDHPYSQLEGNDILADVALGRFPAENSTQVNVMCNKILYYEKMPFTTTTDWYHQGVLCAGSGSGSSIIQVNRYVKTRMVWNDYTRIDTMWYTMGGSIPTTISTAINNGVSYFNYRGYLGVSGWDNSDIDNLSNGRKLPFCTTITCETGGFSSLFGEESTMEHLFKVGTPTTPKGAIGAVGTATSMTNTRCNNTVNMGIYAGIFDEGITQAGNALNRGKLELYNTYQTHDPGNVESFSLWNALAGDPGTELFTKAIQTMTCDVPNTISWGENSLSLTVTETGVGSLEGATVCLYQSGTGGTQVVGFTNETGQVTLPLNVASAGNVKVTITKQNFFPIVDSLDVIQQAVAVGYYSHTIDDDNSGGSSGDNDGIINPGEIVQLPTVFKNFGNATTATNVSVTAAETDPFVTLGNATQTFPDIAPGATGNSNGSFLLTMANNTPHGHVLPLNFNTTSSQGSWEGLLELNVVSYDVNVISAIAGSDTLLSPGETANFIVTIRNEGGKNAASLTATLTSLDNCVTVNDNQASFGTVNVHATASCLGNPFNLTAANNAPPGHLAQLRLAFTANSTVTQVDTITLAMGSKTPSDPQGPDDYGYYCFDNTDLNYTPHPTYSWIEADPRYGGSGTILNLTDQGEDLDQSLNVALPFTFRYYGENVTAITVCTNGWISTWANNSFTDFRNYPIPFATGPNGMIAPFWDDLTTNNNGRVCSWHDAANHRFVVEWSRVPTVVGPTPLETFEVVLFDPAHYPTPTGDGPILFQYNTIAEVYGYGEDNPYSTVGIESPDQQDGIEIVYWNTYEDPAAAPLVNSRAYLFTTAFSYTLPSGNLYVNLTPFGTPIVIPPTGGSFNFNIEVGNSGATPASGDVWCLVTLPSGASYGPVLGPVLGLTFPAGWSLNRNRTQNVPASAPVGSYTYRAMVGIYPSIIYDEATFPFSKSGSVGSGDPGTGWFNTGEEFENALLEAAATPARFELAPAHPNPFNASTVIRYQIPEARQVSLQVYDTAGRLVQTLVNGWREAGEHQVTFVGSDIASGIYLVRLQAHKGAYAPGDFTAMQKLILLK